MFLNVKGNRVVDTAIASDREMRGFVLLLINGISSIRICYSDLALESSMIEALCYELN